MKSLIFRCLAGLCAAGSLVGCGPEAIQQYRDLWEADVPRYRWLEDALEDPSVTPLPRGHTFSFDLNGKEPQLLLNDTLFNFRIWELEGSQGEMLRLLLTSYCHCLGYRKRMVLPRIWLLDAGGKLWFDEPWSWVVREPDMREPLRLEGEWTYALPAEGTYFLVLGADNRRVGQAIAPVPWSYPEGILAFETPGKASPHGKLKIIRK